MATLAELQSRIEDLRKARASGIRRVQHGDSMTEYKSDAEMEKAISDLERQIDAAADTRPQRVKYLYQSGKGL